MAMIMDPTQGEKDVVLHYTPVSDERKEAVEKGKRLAAAYCDWIASCEARFGKSRDLSLARTNAQQASMWATRGLFNPD